MKKVRRNFLVQAGFTLVEVMIAVAVSVIVLGGTTWALISGLQVWQEVQIKSELNGNLELAMDYIRQDLRLSSIGIGLMAFYGTNDVDYSAISMPISVDSNNDGLLDRNLDGSLIWNQTVVYHIRPGSPDQLLRTVFDNRNTNATAADIYTQLSNVVASTTMAGIASACMSNETVTSRVIFENLVDMGFMPPPIYFDGYWPTNTVSATFNWGSLVLGQGNHTLEFEVVDKNAASSGYRVEIDKFALSASGSPREGEIFIPVNSHPAAPYFNVTASGGVFTAVERGDTWKWSGNCALSFVPTGVGAKVTFDVYNDLITDNNFMNPGGTIASNCSVKFDHAFRGSNPFVADVVVSPDKGTAWQSTGFGSQDAADHYYQNMTYITNFVYGGTNYHITRDGKWARFSFQRGVAASLLVTNAAVFEITTGISTNITFNNGKNFVLMSQNGPAVTNSDWVAMWNIDRTNDYAVRYQTAELTGDRDLDMFVGSGNPYDLRFFENTGSQTAPVWAAGVSHWQGINGGDRRVAPAFGDLFGNGKYDLILGVSERNFKVYRNEGTVKNPVMTQIVTPPALSGIGSYNAVPALVDIDNDGDLDFFSGYQQGNFAYCQNTGTVTQPLWATKVSLTNSSGAVMDVGDYSSPAFADIDGDGDYDLFSGGDDAFIRHWENTGTPEVPSWTFVTNQFGNITNASTRCNPVFVDINGDGLLDLFVGALDGKVTFYKNIGTAAVPAWDVPDVIANLPGGSATPAFCNIDADINGAASWTNSTDLILATVNGISTNATIGLSSVEVGYAASSVYRSGVFDTGNAAPAYNQLNWTHLEDKVNAWDVDVRIRASNLRDMSDVDDEDWKDANPADGGYFDNNSGNSLAWLPKKRYFQYAARFRCNEDGSNPQAHTNDMPGAKLRDVTVDWPGSVGLVDLMLTMGRGPDCGVVKLKVDQQDFVKGIQVDMTIFKDSRTGVKSASGTLEVRPLNTGR